MKKLLYWTVAALGAFFLFVGVMFLSGPKDYKVERQIKPLTKEQKILQITPERQKSFTDKWKEISKEFDEAVSTQNDLKIESIEQKSDNLFNIERPVNNWIAFVNKVTTGPLGGIYVQTLNQGIEYSLRPDNEYIKKVCAELRKDDFVRFSGTIKNDFSFHHYGSVKKPEMRVMITQLSKIY